MSGATRRYRVDIGMDTNVTLDVDLTKLTPDLAGEINSFWSDAADILSASGGDAIEAVARRAAGQLFVLLLDGFTESGAVHQLGEREGWFSADELGITVVDHELPDLSPDAFDVAVIKETEA